MSQIPSKASAAWLLVLTSIGGAALVAVTTAVFLWAAEGGIELVWRELPELLDVDATGWPWTISVLTVTGLLLGLGQRYLGNYPRSLEESLQDVRDGQGIEPSGFAGSFVNSAVVIAGGGPFGIEAALTGVVGGSATWAGRRITSVGGRIRQAWGDEQIDGLPTMVRTLPRWVAALVGLAVYRSLPFGQLGMTRFATEGWGIDAADAVTAFVVAAVVAVPIAAIFRAVHFSEHQQYFSRNPLLAGVLGGLALFALTIGSRDVLFSGQEAILHLDELDGAELVYLGIAKPLALCLVLLAGWRGGPIFPLWYAAGAIATALATPLGFDNHVLLFAMIAAVSTVGMNGKVLVGALLSLYVAPFAYAASIALGATGAALALLGATRWGVLPPPAGPRAPAEPQAPTSSSPQSEPGSTA